MKRTVATLVALTTMLVTTGASALPRDSDDPLPDDPIPEPSPDEPSPTPGETCRLVTMTTCTETEPAWVPVRTGSLVFRKGTDAIAQLMMSLGMTRATHVGIMNSDWDGGFVRHNTLRAAGIATKDAVVVDPDLGDLWSALDPGDVSIKKEVLEALEPGLTSDSLASFGMDGGKTYLADFFAYHPKPAYEGAAARAAWGLSVVDLHYSLYAFSNYDAELAAHRSMCSGSIVHAWNAFTDVPAQSHGIGTRVYSAEERLGFARAAYPVLTGIVRGLVDDYLATDCSKCSYSLPFCYYEGNRCFSQSKTRRKQAATSVTLQLMNLFAFGKTDSFGYLWNTILGIGTGNTASPDDLILQIEAAQQNGTPHAYEAVRYPVLRPKPITTCTTTTVTVCS